MAHPRCMPLLEGPALLQEGAQEAEFGVAVACQAFLSLPADRAVALLQLLLRCGRQFDQDAAAIGQIAKAASVAAPLQPIERSGRRARAEATRLGQLSGRE